MHSSLPNSTSNHRIFRGDIAVQNIIGADEDDLENVELSFIAEAADVRPYGPPVIGGDEPRVASLQRLPDMEHRHQRPVAALEADSGGGRLDVAEARAENRHTSGGEIGAVVGRRDHSAQQNGVGGGEAGVRLAVFGFSGEDAVEAVLNEDGEVR